MKAANIKTITLATLLAAALAIPVLAEAGPGMGGGMGNGAGGGAGMQNAGQGNGMGQGMHGGRGMRFNQNNMAGWSLMTPEERTAQQAKMRATGSLGECQALQAEHRSVMEARAKEKGMTLPAARQNGCQRMQALGSFK